MACMVFEKGTPDTLEISQYQAAHFVGDSMLDEDLEDLGMGAGQTQLTSAHLVGPRI